MQLYIIYTTLILSLLIMLFPDSSSENSENCAKMQEF
jgi:hypothetical protein